MSRNTVTVAAAGHQAAEPVVENATEAVCTDGGQYDSVVYCTVCGAEISRDTVTVAALGHTAGEAVKENETEATCTEAGGYDNVVYCSVCGAEISRDTVTVAALGHTAGEAVKENEVAATCTDTGSYDSVVYCTVCSAEMSRETITVAALGHTAGTTETVWLYGHVDTNGNITGPECTDGGAYQEITYCSVCGEPMTYSEEIRVDPPGHDYQLNGVCSTCGELAIYASVSSDRPYVEYVFAEEWFNGTLVDAGVDVASVQLWCPEAGAYINSGGYEGGDGGNMMIGDEYRDSGTTFRVDITLSNGEIASSNIATMP